MIVSIIGTRGGIGSTTLLSNLFTHVKKNETSHGWLSLTSPFPPLFAGSSTNWKKVFSFKRNIPQWNNEKCTYCNECVSICVNNAISPLPNGYNIYSELCNSCKTCISACKSDAIKFELTDVGFIEISNDTNFNLHRLNLNEKEIISTWHIKEIFTFLRAYKDQNSTFFIDIPSGLHEYWEEILKLSSSVIIYSDDPFTSDLIYKSHSPRQAKLILAITQNSKSEFEKAGYSFAIPIPKNKIIAFDSIQGKTVTDIDFNAAILNLKKIILEKIPS